MAGDKVWEELGRRLEGRLIKVAPPPSAYFGVGSEAWSADASG